PNQLRPENLVYCIYTSGSTGNPKGVLIKHDGLVAHIHNVKALYGFSSESRFLQFFNVAFDAAAEEIFVSLCFGASLYMRTSELDPAYIYDLISKHKITHADFPTAFFNTFIAKFSEQSFPNKLEFCAIGGEKLEKGILEKYWSSISSFTKAFYNVYGPTETTLTATWYPIMVEGNLSKFENTIPIGKSFAGRQVLILNEKQNLQPIGVVGEICIGGDGLAKGYLNNSKLTEEKFIPNPYREGERLYRTGDLGRWLPDGNVEFIGRKDDQVKIRGYRIELGEIEHALLQKEDIEQAIVLVNENKLGERELFAYIVADEGVTSVALRNFLYKRIPPYMVPAKFIAVSEIPVTPNGKTDKKALPRIQGKNIGSGIEYMAPRNQIESDLSEIWSEVLGVDQISILDNFFDLGGNSLKLILLNEKINETLKREDSIMNLFRFPSIKEFAEFIGEIQKDNQLDNGTIEETVEEYESAIDTFNDLTFNDIDDDE
ncbi:MAG: non-ribosomal peptide synthetase, partial [Flavobacteriales bacterium]|nr:non-ribosomal peptide synthetase [Flavobacteriales bacterium]